MTDDEKAAYLTSYDDWRSPPPEGWNSMAEMPLNAREAEFLFNDGTTEDWPISNAQFLISAKRPLAWRNALSHREVLRKRVIGWTQKADDVGLWTVIRAIQTHERKLSEAGAGDYGRVTK